MNNILQIKGVSKKFGDVQVLRNIELNIPKGEITAFIGPNGAGKTTLLNTIAGHIHPDTGSVSFEGNDITGNKPYDIAMAGIGRQFQDVRVFGGLTARENVLVGMLPMSTRDFWRNLFPGKTSKLLTEFCKGQDADDWLRYVGLDKEADRLARELSFGQQKLLSLARLFARGSRLLLLDEPTAGVSPTMVQTISGLVHDAVRKRGTSVIMVEHNMSVVDELATHIHFLHEGKVDYSGNRAEVLGNSKVQEIYMGM